MSPGDLLLLEAPSANRVYAAQASQLAAREARWVLGAHGIDTRLAPMEIAGLPMLHADGAALQDATAEEAHRLLATLSTVGGAFDVVDAGTQPAAAHSPDAQPASAASDALPLLRPRPLPAVLRHPSDLETTLKYSGKTNEQFTALLVNLAIALTEHRGRAAEGTLRLLDPMSGRGTTLHRALRLGLSPVGAEIDAKDVEAHRGFLTTWLRTHRYKHTVDTTRLTRSKRTLGTRVDARLAVDRAAQRSGDEQTLTVYGCDTAELGDLLPGASIDAIVADLPYGVQHGARAGGSWKRSPLELLARVAPVWRGLLRPTGGIALALNRRTAPYPESIAVLEDAGFAVLSTDGEFQHRVDHSIERDVLLAVPADHPGRERLARLAAPEPTTEEDPHE